MEHRGQDPALPEPHGSRWAEPAPLGPFSRFQTSDTCTCVSVFSVDYNDELDLLVSGSADFSVKVWALSAGACLNTLTGHTEWVTKVRGPAPGGPGPRPALLDPRSCLCLTVMVLLLKVILQRSEVESVLHAPGDYILLSADKYEIKVGGAGAERLQVQRLQLCCPRRSGLWAERSTASV